MHLVTTHNLIDCFLHRFPHHPTFGTHTRGHRRIDSVYVTPRLLPSLLATGYAPFHFSTPSDHRSVCIEFDTQSLFGQQQHPIPSANARIVKSKDKKAVTQFIDRWYNEILDHDGLSLYQRIRDGSATPSVVERLDAIIGLGSDTAEKSCKRRRPEFYSSKLVQQRIRVSILRGHLNALKLGIDRSPQLRHKMQRAGLDFQLPPTQRLTSNALTLACTELHQICRDHAEARQKELEEKNRGGGTTKKQVQDQNS